MLLHEDIIHQHHAFRTHRAAFQGGCAQIRLLELRVVVSNSSYDPSSESVESAEIAERERVA